MKSTTMMLVVCKHNEYIGIGMSGDRRPPHQTLAMTPLSRRQLSAQRHEIAIIPAPHSVGFRGGIGSGERTSLQAISQLRRGRRAAVGSTTGTGHKQSKSSMKKVLTFLRKTGMSSFFTEVFLAVILVVGLMNGEITLLRIIMKLLLSCDCE